MRHGARTIVGDRPNANFRVRALTLGAHRVDEPIVTVDGGDTPDVRHAEGLVGIGVLSRFIVTIDLPRQRMFLRPGDPPGEAANGPTTGLGLAAFGPDLRGTRVDFVAPDSPAAEAGFAVGDEILEVDHRPAPDAGLRVIRSLLQESIGRAIPFRVRRNGEEVELIIVPKRRL